MHTVILFLKFHENREYNNASSHELQEQRKTIIDSLPWMVMTQISGLQFASSQPEVFHYINYTNTVYGTINTVFKVELSYKIKVQLNDKFPMIRFIINIVTEEEIKNLLQLV